ncbi:MAG: anti-sigma factor [Acidimicrobiales bacterium]|jgi:anti-sigma-K factor RskA|nr:anti-sigma factor [Acidimicrobiales bacterium]
MPTDPFTPDPADGPEADRLLRALRGDGDDLVLARVGRALRELEPEDATLTPPPTDLWSRIEAAAGTGPARTGGGGGPASISEATAEATVVPFRRRWFPAVAAAAVVVIVAGVVVAVTGGSDDSSRLVAVAQLEALQGDTPAVAELVEADDTLKLDLDLSAFTSPDGEYLEVWLLRPDVSGMVSLGPASPDGVYPLPEGVDPGEFPVVDVSFEPADGDEAHSGNSLLRGPLEFQA